jgi:hypothetical protein
MALGETVVVAVFEENADELLTYVREGLPWNTCTIIKDLSPNCQKVCQASFTLLTLCVVLSA